MSPSTDNAYNTSTCVEDKVGDGSTEDVAAKQLVLQIDHLSIENEGGDIPTAMASTDNADNTDNVTTCAACGNEGDKESMNICNKCKMVYYCNAACKKKHKSKHKKKCDRRVAELHDVDLFKASLPREDCPICFIPLPLDADQSSFQSCCGKIVCNGCIYAMVMEEIRNGKKNEEVGICAFCRTPPSRSDEETVQQLKRQIEKGNADAINNFASCYVSGTYGMSQNWAKANELYLKAGELGSAEAYSNLGNSYYHGRGVEIDKKKATHFFELGAMMGYVSSRNKLGAIEDIAGNHNRAMKHFILSSNAGDKISLDIVQAGFRGGIVTKGEYESTLRAFHERQTETKSDARNAAADFQTRIAAERN